LPPVLLYTKHLEAMASSPSKCKEPPRVCLFQVVGARDP
jgi:hypothetical protein